MSEITGNIYRLGETETFGANGFKKRLIVIETNEQYSQTIPVEFVQDKCEVLDNYQIGEKVKISVNIRGNEYQGKFYCSLNGWKIERV